MVYRKKTWIEKRRNFLIISFILILEFLAIGYLIYSSGNISLSPIINNILGKDINQTIFENPEPNNNKCSYTFRDDTICKGEKGTADLEYDNNANCKVGFKYIFNNGTSTEWKYYGEITLDENGEGVLHDYAGITGEYEFRMICEDANGMLCTDSDIINVINCGDDSDDNDNSNSNDCGENNPIETSDCSIISDSTTCEQSYMTSGSYHYECIWEEDLQFIGCKMSDNPC